MSQARAPIDDDPAIGKLLDDFDRAWQNDREPRIEDYLALFARGAPSAAVRRAFVEELVKIDLDYRWSAPPAGSPGRAPAGRLRLEDYVARYPDLGPLGRLSPTLIGEEYRSRKRAGDQPTHGQYAARFSTLGAALWEVLLQIDAEISGELATRKRGAAEALREQRSELAAAVPAPMPVPSHVNAAMPTQPQDTVAGLLETLRGSRLLSVAQVNELAPPGRPPSFRDGHALAKDLLRRGWLTPYQVNQLCAGRGPELVLGPYVLLERLGEGGAGQVFKAHHRKMDRLVALKLIRKELLADPEVVGRFYREIQVLSQLDHPNVVRAYDAGPAGAAHFLAMEFVEGTDLGKLVKQGGPLPVQQACEYIRQAALGLQHAHERGLVHRDIKPHNLIMSLREGRIKVADLGLARLPRALSQEATVLFGGAITTGTLTPENAVMMGTADYLAPEQALEFHQADIRADIYSLGCTFFYLLTGQSPFAGGTLAQKVARHMHAEPPAVEQVRAEVPAEIGRVIRRMLAKRPEDRYQKPADVAAALAPRSGAANPRAERNKRLLNRLLPLGGRLRSRRVAGALLVGLAALLLAWVFWPGSSASPLDSLRASDIPTELRLKDVPELVAVLGKTKDQEPVSCVGFGDAGKMLIAANLGGGAVRLWRFPHGEDEITEATTHAVAFAQGWVLAEAAGSAGPVLELWKVPPPPEKRGRVASLPGDWKGWTSHLVPSADGKLLASLVYLDAHVRFWDLSDIQRPMRLGDLQLGEGTVLYSLAIHPRAGETAIGAQDGQVFLVGLEGTVPRKLRSFTAPGPIYALAYSPDGRLLASGCLQFRKVQVWDLSSEPPTERHVFDFPAAEVRAVAFDPHGHWLAAAGGDGGDASSPGWVLLWEAASAKVVRRWKLPGTAHSVAFAPDGRHLAVGSDRNLVYILRLTTPRN